MTKEKNNMDEFLRGSLNDIEIQPSQSVWKKISKRLLILELIHLNFSNLSKYWLYSVLIALMVIPGITYLNLKNNNSSENSISENSIIGNIGDSPVQEAYIVDSEKSSASPIEDMKTEDSRKNIIETTPLPSSETTTSTYEQSQKNIQKQEFEETTLLEERDDAIPNKNQENYVAAPNLVVLPIIAHSDKGPETKKTDKPSTEQKTNSNTTQTHQSQTEIQTKTAKERNTELNRIQPKTIKGSSFFSIYIYEQGIINIPPLKISSRTKPYKFDKPKTKKEKQKISKKNKKNSFKKNKKDSKYPNPLIEHPTYNISANYQHDWPSNFKENIPQTNLFSINGGINYKRFEAGIGIGIQSGQNKTAYQVHYSSMDSVGYYYDIDYYEIIPDNPDSIIIHYTMVPTFDTVNHTDLMEIKQKSRWVVLPIRVAYEVLKKESYILAIGLSARFGWEYYQETMPASSIQSITEITYKPLGSAPTNSYITLGIGIENQIKVYKNWWFIVEPKAFYYLKTPYKWDGSQNHGPFGFGINTGIRFKF